MVTQRITLPIYNLSCEGEGTLVMEHTLSRTPGVAQVYITYNPQAMTAAALTAAIALAWFGRPSNTPEPIISRVPGLGGVADVRLRWQPFAAALLASIGQLTVYLSSSMLAQGWTDAAQQLTAERLFIA